MKRPRRSASGKRTVTNNLRVPIEQSKQIRVRTIRDLAARLRKKLEA